MNTGADRFDIHAADHMDRWVAQTDALWARQLKAFKRRAERDE